MPARPTRPRSPACCACILHPPLAPASPKHHPTVPGLTTTVRCRGLGSSKFTALRYLNSEGMVYLNVWINYFFSEIYMKIVEQASHPCLSTNRFTRPGA